jgi:hypothetical protein
LPSDCAFRIILVLAKLFMTPLRLDCMDDQQPHRFIWEKNNGGCYQPKPETLICSHTGTVTVQVTGVPTCYFGWGKFLPFATARISVLQLSHVLAKQGSPGLSFSFWACDMVETSKMTGIMLTFLSLVNLKEGQGRDDGGGQECWLFFGWFLLSGVLEAS